MSNSWLRKNKLKDITKNLLFVINGETENGDLYTFKTTNLTVVKVSSDAYQIIDKLDVDNFTAITEIFTGELYYVTNGISILLWHCQYNQIAAPGDTLSVSLLVNLAI